MRAVIGVCWKAVDLHATVDRLTGKVFAEPGDLGTSPADEAALEWALRLAESWDCAVVVVTAGDVGCEAPLRSALAAGASRAVRVSLHPEAPSAVVAAGLANVLRQAGAAAVLCGDASLDRGSGSVPAFLASELRAAQALGLVRLAPEPGDRALLVDRRLDGGQRERLRVREPFVVSVETGVARLRRAPLPSVLAARSAVVEVVDPSPGRGAGDADPAGRPGRSVSQLAAEHGLEGGQGAPGAQGTQTSGAGRAETPPTIVGIAPFRPRARVVAPPPVTLGPRERVMALTSAPRPHGAQRTLALPPDEAAAAILQALSDWGELP